VATNWLLFLCATSLRDSGHPFSTATGSRSFDGGIVNDIRVLCVESHPESLAVLRVILEGIGYEVMAATTARQALELLQVQAVDGVLLEYDLPDAAGASVRAEMKRIRPEVPVLIFEGISTQTPFLLRFFDHYLRDPERTLHELDA
jgi:CheY-like chemotaxis protein